MSSIYFHVSLNVSLIRLDKNDGEVVTVTKNIHASQGLFSVQFKRLKSISSEVHWLILPQSNIKR